MNRVAGQNVVRLYLEQEGISQADLAQRADVSQATVSRALTSAPKRHAGARAKLFDFIQKQPGAPVAPPSTLADAVTEVWDGTEQHDAALAALVVASAELWPKMKGGG